MINTKEIHSLSAKIAYELSYCGPLQKKKAGNRYYETTFVFGFEISKAHKIAEQMILDYLKTKTNKKP